MSTRPACRHPDAPDESSYLGRAAHDEQQIALFDDVLIRLSEQVEIVARRRLSKRLAAISDPPCGIIRTLAKDQNKEVALPVLPDCELDDDALTKVATTNGQGHLQAIARRVGWIALRDRHLTDVDSLRMSALRRKRDIPARSIFDPKRSWSGRPTQKRPPRSAASFIFKPSRERAALAWAETVTRVADTAIPDDEFESASAVFSEKEPADLTIAIGLMNAFNRLAIGFRNPPKAAT